MSHRSRIAHFKTPFILSVAAPAALGMACGGQAALSDTTGGAGSSSVSNGGSAPILPPPSLPCSGPAPAVYGYCQSAVCVDGQWKMVYNGGCNPPLPPREDCPASEPLSGTSCSGYAADLSCSYEYCYGVTPTRRCNGTTQLWEALAQFSCNSPAPDTCPDAMPIAGSDCTEEAQECRYDGCQGPQSSVAICSFGQWTTAYSSSVVCNPPALQPVCPTRTLSVGEGCAFDGQACSQEPCTSASRNGFVCSAGAWQATVLSCGADAGSDAGG